MCQKIVFFTIASPATVFQFGRREGMGKGEGENGETPRLSSTRWHPTLYFYYLAYC
jgi:hypothetical protein